MHKFYMTWYIEDEAKLLAHRWSQGRFGGLRLGHVELISAELQFPFVKDLHA